jgi:hypothetical protein
MSTYTHFSPVDRWSIYFFVKPLWSPSSRWDIFSFSISFFAHECCPSLFPLLIMEIDHSVVPLFFFHTKRSLGFNYRQKTEQESFNTAQMSITK